MQVLALLHFCSFALSLVSKTLCDCTVRLHCIMMSTLCKWIVSIYTAGPPQNHFVMPAQILSAASVLNAHQTQMHSAAAHDTIQLISKGALCSQDRTHYLVNDILNSPALGFILRFLPHAGGRSLESALLEIDGVCSALQGWALLAKVKIEHDGKQCLRMQVYHCAVFKPKCAAHI